MSSTAIPDEPTGSCLVCTRHDPYEGLVCDSDRRRLWDFLGELCDLAPLLPYALVPGRTARGPRVSVTREAPLPLRLDALNLIGPAATATVHDTPIPVVRTWTTIHEINGRQVRLWHRQVQRDEAGQIVTVVSGDQVGQVPVAALLADWASEWCERRAMREHRPAAAEALALWLRDRLEWACDRFEQVGEFATEVTGSLYAARGVLALSRKPITYQAPCPGCGMLSLQRPTGRADYIECRNCGRLITEDEYADRHNPQRRAS